MSTSYFSSISSLSHRISAWCQTQLLQPLHELSYLERFIIIVFGLWFGIFPIPGTSTPVLLMSIVTINKILSSSPSSPSSSSTTSLTSSTTSTIQSSYDNDIDNDSASNDNNDSHNANALSLSEISIAMSINLISTPLCLALMPSWMSLGFNLFHRSYELYINDSGLTCSASQIIHQLSFSTIPQFGVCLLFGTIIWLLLSIAIVPGLLYFRHYSRKERLSSMSNVRYQFIGNGDGKECDDAVSGAGNDTMSTNDSGNRSYQQVSSSSRLSASHGRYGDFNDSKNSNDVDLENIDTTTSDELPLLLLRSSTSTSIRNRQSPGIN